MGQNRNVELDNFEQTYYNAQDKYEDESSWLRNKNIVQRYDSHNDKLIQLALKDATAMPITRANSCTSTKSWQEACFPIIWTKTS